MAANPTLRRPAGAARWPVARNCVALRAAVLHEHGATPQVDDFDDPRPTSDGVVVDVAAAGLHHLDLHKASGRFYMGPSELPRVVGTDGVGRLEDGRRIYFVGTVAVQAAKVQGAGRVVGADLAGERLERMLERGADAVVAIDAGDDLAAALRVAAGGDVNVTIDMLWAAPALAAIAAAARFARHVEVGNMAGAEVTLPAPLIRSKSLDMCGFNVAHPPLEVRREGYLRLTEHAA